MQREPAKKTDPVFRQLRLPLQFSFLKKAELTGTSGTDVLVIDARRGRRPDARERHMLRDFDNAQEDHIRAYCRGIAFVFKSKLVRGALTAVNWLRKPVAESKCFTDFDEAMAWAEKRLDI